MATIIPFIHQSKVISNLDTYNYTVKSTEAGMFTVSAAVSEHPVSGIILTIQQNGSTVATSPAPAYPALIPTVTGAGSGPLTAPTGSQIGQQLVQLNQTLNCAAGDLISVIVSSSTAHDAKPNDFKGLLTIRQGLV